MKQPNLSTQSDQTEAGDAILPQGFVYLDTVDPTILNELRYSVHHNFVGRPIIGYEGQRVIMTRQAAQALARVQRDLRPQGLTLKVYDAYRPQRAVDNFVAWSLDVADSSMKAEFYPRVDKARVFDLGYVARRSGHSRGSTVDLTLVPLDVPAQASYRPGDPLVDGCAAKGVRFDDNSLDMGTGFDVFDPLSHTDSPLIKGAGRVNRDLLRGLMDHHGFQNLETEWWHYTLRDEPFPETYFDFVVRDDWPVGP